MRSSFPRSWVRSTRITFVFAVGLVWLAGCGRPVGSVSGTVSYKGTPLKGGTITFISTEGQPSAAATLNTEGKYTIPSITGGAYTVCVETASLKPPPNFVFPKNTPSVKLDPNTPVPEGYTPSSPNESKVLQNARRYVPIPEHYGDQKKTDLTFTAGGGEQTHDIDLK